MSNNPFMPNTNAAPASAGAPMPGHSTDAANGAFTVDLTNVDESGAMVPEGSYKAKCIDVQQGVSKSGNPMFIWEFELVGDECEGKYKGRTMKSWTAITPAAMWKVAETVIALGVGQAGQVVKFKRSDVLNKLCGLVIEEDEYNGKKTSRVKTVIPVSELGA